MLPTGCVRYGGSERPVPVGQLGVHRWLVVHMCVMYLHRSL